ncbi:sigma-70 family RNA polymerase sigma factor [Candidatus Uhrbacteria bacterium]|nr:sigma-70 family RNA polymerase sigma factor [Candidatus Uhrbacteria bacterium]
MSDFLKFYEEEREALYNFILGRVRHREEAEDMISEVFVRAIRFEKEGGNVTHARGLLYRIAKNLIIDRGRGKKKDPILISIHEERDENRPLDIPDELPRADELFDREIVANEIQSILSRLREESREIIELRYFQQLDIEEIAETLEKSEGAIRVQLHRATNELRDLFHSNDGK